VAGAGVKLLNKRIRSVKSTQQITKAMKMVAAAKLQRSQGKMLAARPYSQKLTELMTELAGKAEISHPLFDVRPVQNVAQKAVDASIAGGAATRVYAVGRKAADFFRKRGYDVFASHVDFGGEANSERGNLVGNAAVQAFLDHTFDEVRIVYASFVSTMTQTPIDVPLLPIAPDAMAADDDEDADALTGDQDYIWEPSQEEMFATLLPLYLKNRVFMTLSEAFTSEHAARMTSMSAATENAGEMIDALTLQRNRERQAAITSELLDIVGGANAL
jgi:F-type H+-transporting ATPase subunit gamma